GDAVALLDRAAVRGEQRIVDREDVDRLAVKLQADALTALTVPAVIVRIGDPDRLRRSNIVPERRVDRPAVRYGLAGLVELDLVQRITVAVQIATIIIAAGDETEIPARAGAFACADAVGTTVGLRVLKVRVDG